MWPHVWRLCKRTSQLNTINHTISTNLTLCWKRKKHAHGLQSRGWWANWLTKVICSFVKAKAMQNFRADRQFNFWSRTPCVPRPRAADVTSRFRNKKRQNIGASTDNSVCGKSSFSTVYSRVTSTSTRRYAASGLDPGIPVSLDVRFAEDPSLPSCLPNMPRQLSRIWWLIFCKRTCCVF